MNRTLLWHWYWAVRNSLHVGGSGDVSDAAAFACILGSPYEEATLAAINGGGWRSVRTLMAETAEAIYPFGMAPQVQPDWYEDIT